MEETRIDSVSTKSSRRSSKSKKNSVAKDIESEDISMSQLELLANKKKLNKAESNVNVPTIKEESVVPPYVPMKEHNKTTSSRRSSTSISSSSSDDTKHRRRKQRSIEKENQNDHIRKEKSDFLCKFNKLNIQGKWSSLKLDMNNSLDEIRNEYERVRNEIQNERSVAFFKRMLLLGVQGIEMLNTKFDPLGVDLDGWSEAMGYSMENQEYDEVLSDLYEKYKGAGQMSPEVKLIFMIISSATMFTISKKITKMDSTSALKSLIGGLMGSKNNQQQMQQQIEQQQAMLQQQAMMQQAMQQQAMQQQAMATMQQRDLTETTEDFLPSKMNGPSNDTADLNNILKTMNERKKAKERLETETTDDIFKNIQVTPKKGRGRPPKKPNAMKLF